MPIVVKIGGSLYDLPDLSLRIQAWLQGERRRPIVFFPGGGPMADVVRSFDQTHRLGEETAHWMALRSLSLNAQFLALVLPHTRLITNPHQNQANDYLLSILDPWAFFDEDESQPDHLPHLWQVTSDSLALRVAQKVGARELVLLKSVGWEKSWQEAAQAGIVDAYFPIVHAANPCPVRIVNLRTWSKSR